MAPSASGEGEGEGDETGQMRTNLQRAVSQALPGADGALPSIDLQLSRWGGPAARKWKVGWGAAGDGLT